MSGKVTKVPLEVGWSFGQVSTPIREKQKPRSAPYGGRVSNYHTRALEDFLKLGHAKRRPARTYGGASGNIEKS
jgi:hypothetical protein